MVSVPVFSGIFGQSAKKPRRARRDDLECAPGGTPSVIAYGDATFPKGTAFVVAGKFPAQPIGVPLGELASAARLRGYFARKKAPEGGCSPGKKGLMILYLLPL